MSAPRRRADPENAIGRPTILFDKDGTLIEDVPYNVDPERIRLAPGARPALRRLADAGFAAAVVTNQTGVARGFFTLRDLDGVRDRMMALLGEQGVELRGFYACPHFPMGTVAEFAIACDCRKPGGGLVRRAIAELGLVASETWVVGDSWADVAAGRSAGCRTVLVGPEWRLGAYLPPGRRPEVALPDLAAGIDAILRDHAARASRDGAGASEPEGALTQA
ncbi:MAG TPA: HAD family hydrolase [Candidatus Limnocylindrales bacterium]